MGHFLPDPIERLTTQARAWAPAAAKLLDRIGVERGWVCADLGCGPIGILDLLSERVGRRGRVVGVEKDAAALFAATVATAEHPNVRLVPADARMTDLPLASFDLVHARFVGQEAGAGPLLVEMIALAKPGGVIVLQEPGPEPWEIDPPLVEGARLVRRVTREFLPRPSSIGPALPALFRKHGLTRVTARKVQLALRGGDPYAAMPRFALGATRDALGATGAATPEEIRRLDHALRRAADDPTVRHRSFRLWQVVGYRPAGLGAGPRRSRKASVQRGKRPSARAASS